MTDDDLIRAMLDPDRAIGRLAKLIYDKRHANDLPAVREPRHCAECFEGCDKCNWGKRA